jgi:hypothetical protein
VIDVGDVVAVQQGLWLEARVKLRAFLAFCARCAYLRRGD